MSLHPYPYKYISRIINVFSPGHGLTSGCSNIIMGAAAGTNAITANDNVLEFFTVFFTVVVPLATVLRTLFFGKKLGLIELCLKKKQAAVIAILAVLSLFCIPPVYDLCDDCDYM